MNPSQVIVLAIPVFFGLIAIEYAWGRWRGRDTYRLGDTVNSLGLGVLSQISAVFTRVLRVGLYTAAFQYVALWRDDAFWTTWYGWSLALVFYDLCYYWLHRLGHTCAVLWAAHVVHHQSQHYNLTTALRQTSSGALLGWLFYLPMALAGVPPLVFGVVALIDLLYQFWVHTEHVPRLGWFDRWFCSPSNHRVHHAVNDRYLDKNYGGVWVVWDRLFGTFIEEDPDEVIVYGTRAPLQSWDPLWANAEVYASLARDAWRAERWRDKLLVWFKPPGWRPADVAERWPREPFELGRVTRYDPPASRATQVIVGLQFVLAILASGVFLWFSETMSLAHAATAFAALTAWLWSLGALLQGRIGWGVAAMTQAAAAATTAAAWELPVFALLKPLPLIVAIVCVANRGLIPGTQGTVDAQRQAQQRWLLAALTASLAGDLLLLDKALFVAGLLAFLLAHLAYLRLFHLDARWFASRAALGVLLALGAGVLGLLWFNGLPVGLRAPVLVYVLAIALMAAQAMGRARVWQDPPAAWTAVGACLFMLSDGILATNRFVQPLSASALGVLGTYYAAQCLIAFNALRSRGA